MKKHQLRFYDEQGNIIRVKTQPEFTDTEAITAISIGFLIMGMILL